MKPIKELQGKTQSPQTGLLMLATLFSRLLGFLRIAVIGSIFGGQSQADIIHLVFSIPNNLRKLLAEGALSTAFVPVFSLTLRNRPQEESQKLIGSILAFQALVLSPFLLLAAIAPEILVEFLLDFQDAESMRSASELFRYMAQFILPVSWSALIMAVLNSKNEFIVPGVTPLLFSISVISCLLLFHNHLSAFSVALGVLIGGFAQVLFQLPKYYALGFKLKFNLNFANPDFKRVLRNFFPILASSSILAINQIIAFNFASGLDVGSATALSNAIVFWQLPHGIFSASIVTVFYPKMSREIDRPKLLANTVLSGLSALIAFLLPSSLFLMLLNYEIVAIALQRGNFLLADTKLAAEVLFWYSPGLVFVGLNTFLQRLCISYSKIKIPIINAGIITFLDISLSLILKETVLGVRGLALANSISFGLAFLWILFTVRRRFITINFRRLMLNLLKILLSMIPAFVILLIGRNIFGRYWTAGFTFQGLLQFLGISLPAAVSVLGLFFAFKVDAINLLFKRRPKVDQTEDNRNSFLPPM